MKDKMNIVLSIKPKMKTAMMSGFLCGIFISSVFSQDGVHVNGGLFTKTIEYNIVSRYDSSHNFNSKYGIQKTLFGDFNAPFEFFHLPSDEAAYTRPPSGVRIVRNSLNTACVLEVRYISNYIKALEEARKKYPLVEGNITSEHNKSALAKQHEEMRNLFRVESRSFPVSKRFADKMYVKTVSLIDKFKAKGVPPAILDGYTVTFRTVVDDEVWSLYIHEPQGNTRKMADLCQQIITDALAGKLDEAAYMAKLSAF